jgi:hypothetical protein
MKPSFAITVKYFVLSITFLIGSLDQKHLSVMHQAVTLQGRVFLRVTHLVTSLAT